MRKIAAVVLVLFLVCSCTPAIVKNNANLMKLKAGMAQDEVSTIMGVPALSESYEASGGERVTILYYRTEEKETTVLSAKEECTPIVFVNGKLAGWGDRLTASDINLLKVKTK
ncbi:MAG TPA: DUF3192 domain-containing protein [Syntrophales bacterium]|nr:DUF3192 domain-containing protein [Syntrophales bacterium]